jgi:hypothetical protein
LTYALVDPLHGLIFRLAGGDPVWGYDWVILFGFFVVGVAGFAVARVIDVPQRWALLAGVAAACSPQLVATLGDGQTEAVGIGWAGLFIAALVRFSRRGGWWSGSAAAILLVLAWYAGPYNGIFASVAGAGIGLAQLRRRPSMLAVGAAALVFVLPFVVAIGSRPEGLPGTGARAEVLPPLDRLVGWRAGLAYGVDWLDLWVPLPLTGEAGMLSHTGYLGLVSILLAVTAVWRRRSLWPYLAGVVVFSLLALGPWWTVGGEVVRFGDRVVPAPAGVLCMAFPVFWRITRWYRAAALAALILATLAAWALSRMPRRFSFPLAALVFIDLLVTSPVSWPVPLFEPPDAAPLSALSEPGAIFMLPSSTFGEPPPGRYRDIGPLLQAWHGRSISGGLMGEEGWIPVSGLLPEAVRLARRGRMRTAAQTAMLDYGFRYLVILPEYRTFTGWRGNFIDCFGKLEVETDLYAAVDLRRFDVERCGEEGGLLPPPPPVGGDAPLAQPPPPIFGSPRRSAGKRR